MSFLAPLFFLGLGAIAVPILVHLIQRERKRVVEFPSLMFVQKIPYQSVRRRRIRHWFLLLMRAAAIALIVAAFARPFLPARRRGDAGRRRRQRARWSILLDQSASMGYGDHWQRAQRRSAQARSARSAPTTRRRSCCSAATPRRTIRATSDRGRLEAALGAAKVTSGAHALRPGAQAGREHPRALDAAAQAKRS